MSKDARALLVKARQLIEISGSPSPKRDASALMDAVSGDLRPWDPVPEAVATRFMQMVERRTRGEPVSHITQSRAFWNHDFKVTADVLDPRPDTETLVEAALGVPFERVLDLGTGSGCILLSLLSERPLATGVGTDLSEKALEIAQTNAMQMTISHAVKFQISDWFSNIPNIKGTFDLIVSNPPYIDSKSYETLEDGVKRFEPKMALTPGGDGLAPYRILTAEAGAYLAVGGWLMVEIGYDQGDTVCEIFRNAGWDNPVLIHDLNGKPRVVKAQACEN